jgi:hypothetical protein
MSYIDEAQSLREQFVPDDGTQSATVQGELVRALDVLRSSADGKCDDDHAPLVDFLHEILLDGLLFEEQARAQLETDLAAIREGKADDLAYERVTERIVDFARLHPELLPHHPNPSLTV